MTRLRYRYHLLLARAGDDLTALLDERTVHILDGQLYARLLPLLDGRRTEDDIVDALAPDVPPAHVYFTLGELERKGLLAKVADMPLGHAAYWSALGADPVVVEARLRQSLVAIESIGIEADAIDAARGALLSAGVRLADRSNEAALVLYLVDDYLQPALAEINRSTQRPWMLAKPIGMETWIGPIFEPGASCWACLAHRLASHRQVQHALMKQSDHTGPLRTSIAALPPMVESTCALAAAEAARYVGGAGSALIGRIRTLDAATLQAREHRVLKRDDCAVCGRPRVTDRSPRPVVLQPTPIAYAEDGGFRSVPPDQLLARLEHLVSPITGIVPVLQRRGEGLVSAYVSGFNQAFPIDDFNRLRRSMRIVTAGKGKTDAQARASGLAEALERYCGAFHDDVPRRAARFDELGGAARHPHDLLLFSQEQYATRDRQPARTFNPVPAPFDENEVIDWTPAWSMTRGEGCWLPTAFCFVGCKSRFCGADSNGNAAGHTIEEAILQGLLELCERDAVALWWYNRLRRPALDLASLDEPYVQQLIDTYARLGRDLWVLDITSDLGVPACAAVSRKRGGASEQIVLGFGAHIDVKLAVMRAMTEVNQLVSGTLSEEVPPKGADADVDAWLEATVDREPYLAGHGSVDAAAYQRRYPRDLRENVHDLRSMLESKGHEVIVLDQSRPEVDLAVVKVVVPGLRHFWQRFAPGRLYDVPVALGWVASPTPEASLNRLRMFL